MVIPLSYASNSFSLIQNRTILDRFSIETGWWFQPFWKNMSQLGYLFPIYREKKTCSKQPSRKPLVLIGLSQHFKTPPYQPHSYHGWSGPQRLRDFSTQKEILFWDDCRLCTFFGPDKRKNQWYLYIIVCMYVCMYVYIWWHVCMCIYMYIYTCLYMYEWIYVSIS